MVHKRLTVQNPNGIHARPAAALVQTAQRFSCDITLEYNRSETDAKSIMGILMMAAVHGAEVDVRCEGNDEASALVAMEHLFETHFGELPH